MGCVNATSRRFYSYPDDNRRPTGISESSQPERTARGTKEYLDIWSIATDIRIILEKYLDLNLADTTIKAEVEALIERARALMKDIQTHYAEGTLSNPDDYQKRLFELQRDRGIMEGRCACLPSDH